MSLVNSDMKLLFVEMGEVAECVGAAKWGGGVQSIEEWLGEGGGRWVVVLLVEEGLC